MYKRTKKTAKKVTVLITNILAGFCKNISKFFFIIYTFPIISLRKAYITIGFYRVSNKKINRFYELQFYLYNFYKYYNNCCLNILRHFCKNILYFLTKTYCHRQFIRYMFKHIILELVYFWKYFIKNG